MSLPVSQYEALLAQVRGLRRQAQHVQELADPFLTNSNTSLQPNQNVKTGQNMENITQRPNNLGYECVYKNETEASEDESIGAHSTQNSVSSEPISQNNRGVSALYHGTWPVERAMWNSEPTTFETNKPHSQRPTAMPSVMSFASSSGAPMERVLISPDSSRSSQQLEAKVDMVYSLLAMLGGQEHADMGETLLALSTNPESCTAMRQSGCLPLLVQLVQSDKDPETRKKASKALRNLVYSQPDEKIRKREVRILKLLETVCAYNEALKNNVEFICENLPEDGDKHPIQTIAHLMKLSFDEGHRQAICQLGGIHAIAKLIEIEHSVHGSTTEEAHCILMRRYACMALTNLTFGDSGNKALLCSYKEFMWVLVSQLQSSSDELRQVTASVLRNLSWRADSTSKEILKEVGCVKGLMKSAMMDNKENTLKSILSALWNLSAHCTENKAEICAVNDSLAFLIQMLQYKSASKSLAIIENAGGILRNISSQIAVRDDYREILREHNCLQILLSQLKSPSLTIVSNACGTLWNLSAKNATDQELLWQLGAPSMLRSLNHSKHKMIAMGSSATLKNLLSAKPGQALLPQMDSVALSLDLPALPVLGARKQKALLKDLDQNLSETFDNLDLTPDQKKKKNHQNQKETTLNIHKSSMSDYENASFASLSYNEPTTSIKKDRKSRIPQCTGPSSLPPMSFVSSTPVQDKRSNLRQYNFHGESSSMSFSQSVEMESGNKEKIREVIENFNEKENCSTEDLSNFEELQNNDEEAFKTQSCDENDLHKPSTSSQNFSKNSPMHQKTQFKLKLDKSENKIFSKNARKEKEDIGGEKNVQSSKCASISSTSAKNKNDDILSYEMVNKPISDNTISTAFLGETVAICSTERIDNPGREEGEVEAIEKHIQDLNRTYDVIGEETCDFPIENDICVPEKLRDSPTEVVSLQNISVDLNISEENNRSCDSSNVHSTNLSALNDEKYESFNQRTQSSIEENLTADVKKSESTKSLGKILDMSPEYTYSTSDNCSVFTDKNVEKLERSCNDSANVLDTRMLDPDAMIESLDRFTAELVSQASSHLQNKDSLYKSNTNNENVWEEISNDVTFPSISGSVPDVVSFNTDDSEKNEPDGVVNTKDQQSNDFSSTNTSTMTESTLIAMEATKMAAVFKKGAEMSNSLQSLELDHVQPPSHLNSLSNSMIGLDSKPNSPKMMRKKSIPSNIMVRRALNNHSLSHTSSIENHQNDLERSTKSITNDDSSESKKNFVINGPVSRDFTNNSSTGYKASTSLLHLTSSHYLSNVTDIENINPPSLFNEITDMCNSLADVATSAICSETEMFEDCVTHIADNNLQTENDVTEFSDANSITPIQSDQNSSSSENTPKKQKSKSITAKQRRTLAKDRYKTYTIAAEMIVRDGLIDFEEQNSNSDDYKTSRDVLVSPSEDSIYASPTYTVDYKDENEIQGIRPDVDKMKLTNGIITSPSKSRISVRKNSIQRRLLNRERFQTQTLNESKFTELPVCDSPPPINDESEMYLMVEKEAGKVLNTLRDTKIRHDDLLDCETLSLVSNEDESEPNSGSSVNYRTYRKSWGFRKNIPVITPVNDTKNEYGDSAPSDEDEANRVVRKPKITKPDENSQENIDVPEDQPKAIRGRRKPLYSRNVFNKVQKPMKNSSSSTNIMKNVTSSLKSNSKLIPKQVTSKPPVHQTRNSNPRPVSESISLRNSPKHEIIRPARPASEGKLSTPKPLERQGTFTKDSTTKLPTKSKIPSFTSRIPSPDQCKNKNSRIPSKQSIPRSGIIKSASSERNLKTNNLKIYNRSTSAESAVPRKIQNSPSSVSLSGKTQQNGAIKKNLESQRSNSNTSLNSSGNSKKQVTSKIASIWKKIEESKKKAQPKSDTSKKWIEVEPSDELSRNEIQEDSTSKRLSRLGSFVVYGTESDV